MDRTTPASTAAASLAASERQHLYIRCHSSFPPLAMVATINGTMRALCVWRPDATGNGPRLKWSQGRFVDHTPIFHRLLPASGAVEMAVCLCMDSHFGERARDRCARRPKCRGYTATIAG